MRGVTLGSISMSCYGVGMGDTPCVQGADAAGLPQGVPPDQTNL